MVSSRHLEPGMKDLLSIYRNRDMFEGGYCDADWAGCSDDRKFTSEGCFFLGNNLISWFSKKQNSVSLSTTEAEYIAAGSAYYQFIWMKQMIGEYGSSQETMILYRDNMSAIDTSKNLV